MNMFILILQRRNDMLTGLIIGLFFGVMLGVFLMCILFVASWADDDLGS